MTDVLLESFRAIVLSILVAYLLNLGRKKHFVATTGWRFIQFGFVLILFGSILDITDNFESLNPYVVVGDTETEAFLEKVVGYLAGFIFLTIGLIQWGPTVEQQMGEITERKRAEDALRKAHVELEEKVEKRTAELKMKISEHKRIEDALSKSKEEMEIYLIDLDASKSNLERQTSEIVELAEKKAELSERLKYEIDVKNRFFSIISHDLKGPFNSLLGMTQMMSQMSDSFSKDKLVEFATGVNEAGNRVFELLQNLLEWSRLQMEGVEPEPETIPLQELTQGSIDILVPIALEKNIALKNRIRKTAAFADRDMVRTVIRNLIANALKFTPPGGSVEVSTHRQGNMIQFTVADTGVGMSREQAEKVFDLDQKTSTTGTAGEKGTGLGLPLCKDMLERNRGQIWVESAPGEGSRFHFTLPIERADE